MLYYVCPSIIAIGSSKKKTVDDSANKLTYETDMLVEANETFLKKDKALVRPFTSSSW
jgi:hypothetical protein